MTQKRYPETHYKKWISDREVNLLWDFVEKNCIAPMQLVFKLQITFGVRVSDAVRINIRDLDFQNKVWSFQMVKTRRILDLPLSNEIITYLRSYIGIYNNQIQWNDGYLAWSPYNGQQHIQESSTRAVWKKFRDKAGFTKAYHTRDYEDGRKIRLYRLTNHVLRHYVINKLYEATKDIRLAAGVAGHSNPGITMKHYFDTASTDRLRSALELIHKNN